MKAAALSKMSVKQLVDRFVEIGIAQDNAIWEDQTGNYNRLYRQKVVLVGELRSRDGDQRRALLQLYDHSNMQVRVNAAIDTLAVAPQAARRLLQTIRGARVPHQSLQAGMTLFNLDNGVFKPT
jgi:hypothetical protein